MEKCKKCKRMVPKDKLYERWCTDCAWWERSHKKELWERDEKERQIMKGDLR